MFGSKSVSESASLQFDPSSVLLTVFASRICIKIMAILEECNVLSEDVENLNTNQYSTDAEYTITIDLCPTHDLLVVVTITRSGENSPASADHQSHMASNTLTNQRREWGTSRQPDKVPV